MKTSRYVGYAALVEQYELQCLPHYRSSEISTAAKGQQLVYTGPPAHYRFDPHYRPDDTLAAQVEFALKYEGINLEILKALLHKTGPGEIEAWLKKTPNSQFARRIGFLYEWFFGEKITITTLPGAGYVDLLDPEQYVVSLNPVRDPRFRVANNLLGTPKFCPLVRNTETLKEYSRSDIPGQIKELIESKSKQVIDRAVAFLYLSETQYSFRIEGEKPSPEKAQRFADLLSRTGKIKEISEDVLLEIQQLVVQGREPEFSFRTVQNWVGTYLSEYRKKIEFIPPNPADMQEIMDGLLEYIVKALKGSSDVVAAAASASFGFVYAHPFLDGNGRIHRFLIHYILERGGFTPKDTIIPVSAAIYANLDEYRDVLNVLSRPIMELTRYTWTDSGDDIDVEGNLSDYYRYFDATTHAEYLYSVVKKAATQDLAHEIEFLISFEKARQGINSFLDMPAKDLNLLIRCLVEQDGKLSKTKREKLFSDLSEDQVQRIEQIVGESFPDGFKQYEELRKTSKAAHNG